jgi:hypothetical protein
VAVIQSFLSFNIGETSSKNRFNPTAIKSVTEDNVLMGLVTYATMVSARQIGLESLSLEINNDIPIPTVIRIDQKKGFIR